MFCYKQENITDETTSFAEQDPIEKIVELYERMLQAEKEKNELLQKLLDKK